MRKFKAFVRISRELRTVGCGIGLSFAFSVTSYAAISCDGTPTPGTVVASSSAIAETGIGTAQFIFRLGEAVGNPTHLTLQISGTAVNGVDFQTLPTQVTIPSGQTTVTLTVTPIADTVTEGTETLTVGITASDNGCVYIGSPDTATISIVEADASLATALDDANLVWISGGKSAMLLVRRQAAARQ